MLALPRRIGRGDLEHDLRVGPRDGTDDRARGARPRARALREKDARAGGSGQAGRRRAAFRARAAQRARRSKTVLGTLCARGRAHERVEAPGAVAAAALRDKRLLRPRPRDHRPIRCGHRPVAPQRRVVPRLSRRREGPARAVAARGRALLHAGALGARDARVRGVYECERADDTCSRRSVRLRSDATSTDPRAAHRRCARRKDPGQRGAKLLLPHLSAERRARHPHVDAPPAFGQGGEPGERRGR